MPTTLSLRTAFCKPLFLLLSLIFVQCGQAQGWKELNPPPNLFNQPIHATASDRSGNVFAAGDFRNSQNEYFVAALNGDTWRELGSGSTALRANNSIYALATGNTGKIYAGGVFTNASGWPYVAEWSGNTWRGLSSATTAADFNSSIFSLCADPLGKVYAAGSFTNSSSFYYVAQWDGNSWTELGSGTGALRANGIIYAVATDSSGNVYAAGHFTNTSGKYYVAKWNGTSWNELGAGTNALGANDYIQTLLINAAGEVYAAGSFTNTNGDSYVARWSGGTWAETGSGANRLNANAVISTLSLAPNGHVYAAGHLTDANGNRSVYEWTGTTWKKAFIVPSDLSVSIIHSLAIDTDGNIFAGGTFTNRSNSYYVAKWNGSEVTEPGRNGRNLEAYNSIDRLAVDTKGHVYAIGNFQNASNRNYIAHWDGATWSELGGDTASLPIDYSVSSITADRKGNVFVGSTFKNATNHYYIAKWDGQHWSELGDPAAPIRIYEPITQLVTDKEGNVYAGGAFGDSSGFSYGVMRWNGTAAQYYAFPPGYPVSLCVDTAGNIYAGNSQPNEFGKYEVVRLNSNGWVVLGNGAAALQSGSPLTALAIDRNGDLLAGSLNNAGRSLYNDFVAKWDGVRWSAAGPDPGGKYAEGRIYSITSDQNGNVYAGAYSATNEYTVAHWDGDHWSELGSGPNALHANSNIYTVTTDTNGNVYAAGLLNNGHGYQYVAMYTKEALTFPVPVIDGVVASYCQNSGMQRIILSNLPDAASVTVEVKLDDSILPVGIDSSAHFTPSILSPGEHTLSVNYFSAQENKSTMVSFTIVPVSTPQVDLTASTTLITANTSGELTVTANAVGGAGQFPLFSFSRSASFTDLLQPESSDNLITLSPASLAFGDNWIYAKMRTSDLCSTSAFAVDSIRIVREVSSGALIDPDFPGQPIGSYPNPFSNNLTLAGLSPTKNYSVDMVSTSGTKVFAQSFTNRAGVTLNLLSLPGTLYWLHLYDQTNHRRIGTVLVIKK